MSVLILISFQIKNNLFFTCDLTYTLYSTWERGNSASLQALLYCNDAERTLHAYFLSFTLLELDDNGTNEFEALPNKIINKRNIFHKKRQNNYTSHHEKIKGQSFCKCGVVYCRFETWFWVLIPLNYYSDIAALQMHDYLVVSAVGNASGLGTFSLNDMYLT